MTASLASAFNLFLVIVGFGLVIFIHELGHFAAAKWAGVRVHQFAIGFGQAMFSYRKGMGFRAGSTEGAYEKLLGDIAQGVSSIDVSRVSPTEYRVNWIPFGGYVKMLGQEDLDPAATSQAPDSYTRKPVWKRMVIISAGVVMNVLLAAALFIVVFMVGREVPAPRIGFVAPDSPAARAQLTQGDLQGAPAGLQPGDEIVRIDGRRPKSFNDVALAVVMSSPQAPLEIVVQRPGVSGELTFNATPKKSNATHMLEIGVGPATSNQVFKAPPNNAESQRQLRDALADAGLVGVDPGMTLVSVAGEPVQGLWPLTRALRKSQGAPVRAVFTDAKGGQVKVDVQPWPIFETATVPIEGDEKEAIQPHLLGLEPATKVGVAQARAAKAGLKAGDVIAQVGAVAWPDIAATITEIRRHEQSKINLTVLRDGEYVDLTAPVDSHGTIGFGVGVAMRSLATTSRVLPPTSTAPQDAGAEHDAEAESIGHKARAFAADRLDLHPGSTILSIDNQPVSNFFQLREALRKATQSALEAKAGADVKLDVRLPIGDTFTAGPKETLTWSLTKDDVATLHALGWRSPIDPALFQLDLRLDKTSNPIVAIGRGFSETRRMTIMTYLTFLRLFQGTVQVNQLKGPVGIAHLGAQIAQHGFIGLLFFLGLISVNLAVINFLPIPIADGGHFVMLAIEKITGKPVSPAIQNIAALAGLALIGVVFIVVTYNDIASLIGG